MESENVPMSSSPPEFDRGHAPGCPQFDEPSPLADESSTGIDFFCDCHHFSEPKILNDGSSIAWPSGWTPEQALVWRDKHGLAAPAPI
jgi:hypothetical protein